MLALALCASSPARPRDNHSPVRSASAPAESDTTRCPQDDWNVDIRVDSFSRAISGRLAMDADTNGDIYIGLLSSDSLGNDSIRVWRSTDGGFAWGRVCRLGADSTTGRFRDYELRVGHDSAGTFVYQFLVCDSPNVGLWLLRHRPDMADSEWLPVAAGARVQRVAADRNIESPERLFVTWDDDSGQVQVAGSPDCGETWPDQVVALTGCARPSVCAGGAGKVYVAAHQADSNCIRVAAFEDNLANPVPNVTVLDSSVRQRVFDASIAADRAAPDSVQTVVALYWYKDSLARTSAHCGFATDGGRTWTTGIWPAINSPRSTWDARRPYVRRSYSDGLFRGVVVMNTSSYDTLVYAFCRAETPSTWEQRNTLNNFSASTSVGAVVDYDAFRFGGCAAYVDSAIRRVYFDSYGFTDVEDQQPWAVPGVTAALFGSDLTMNLARECRATVTVTDCSGRIISRPFDGHLGTGAHRLPVLPDGVPAGCYFVSVRTDATFEVLKLVRLH